MSDFQRLLNATNWSSLHVSSYHSPEEVPELLRAIASSELAKSRSSLSSLEDAVVRQSDLYEAAYYVVAPLIAVLRESLTPNRIGVYDLLFELANGYGGPEEAFVAYEGDRLQLHAACRREVRKGMDVYNKDVFGKNTAVRKTIKDLYECLNEPD